MLTSSSFPAQLLKKSRRCSHNENGKEIKYNIDPSNIGYNFSAKKRGLEEGVNRLFNLIAQKEFYNPSNGTCDDYDVDLMNDVSEWSKSKIDQKVAARGYGITTSDKRRILEGFYSSSVSKNVISDEMNSLKNMIARDGINENELEFVKKAQFVSRYIQSVHRMYNKNMDFNLLTKNEKKLKEESSYISFNNIYDLGNYTVNGSSIDSIASEVLQNLIKKSAEKGPEGHILPRKNPSVSFVCGLPGLGKSSVYINDLKRQGVCCLDLDEMALDVARRYNVLLNDSNQSEIYKIASAIHDCALRKAINNNLDVAIERIGYNKEQIMSLSGNMDKIISAVREKTGRNVNYSYDLLMVAGTSVNSTINNSIRNAEQIFEGEEIRGYSYDQLLLNNDCTIFSYLDCLQNENVRKKFNNIKLGERGKSYESLSVTKLQNIVDETRLTGKGRI